MKVLFSEIAREELEDAANYLELEFKGLGDAFKGEVRQAAERVRKHPLAWSIERGDVRRYLLHRSPYKLLYSIEPDHIFVIAAAHQHRHPDYWIDRKTW
ncbi:MAG: type II toxin-antitoxin system RelE/ParE family toxin [Chloracidobacterium sp.]|nr:type II toxin-antitoxin system RelE/ParE family toxin [Chloracidobacterium sp.]